MYLIQVLVASEYSDGAPILSEVMADQYAPEADSSLDLQWKEAAMVTRSLLDGVAAVPEGGTSKSGGW